MRGRKPKPTGLKILTGNPGKRPLNLNEPAAAPGLPRCPAHLDAVAKKKWHHLAADVTWLAKVDGDMVALYCQAWSNALEAQGLIAKTGKVLKSTEGGLYQNPWVPIYNKAVEQLVKIGALLGLNPSDRSRLQVAPAVEADPFEEMLQRGERKRG